MLKLIIKYNILRNYFFLLDILQSYITTRLLVLKKLILISYNLHILIIVNKITIFFLLYIVLYKNNRNR